MIRRFPLKNLPSPLPPILGVLKIKVPRIGDLGASEWVIFSPETALKELVKSMIIR